MGLDGVELLMDVEERFGVRLPDDEAEGVQTVGDLVEVVAVRVAARRTGRKTLREARDEVLAAAAAVGRDTGRPIRCRDLVTDRLPAKARRKLWRRLRLGSFPDLRLRWSPRVFRRLLRTSLILSVIWIVVSSCAEAFAAWALLPLVAGGPFWVAWPWRRHPPGSCRTFAGVARELAKTRMALKPADELPPPEGVELAVREVVARCFGVRLEDIHPEIHFVRDLFG